VLTWKLDDSGGKDSFELVVGGGESKELIRCVTEFFKKARGSPSKLAKEDDR